MRGWLLVALLLLPVAGAAEATDVAESIILRTSLTADVVITTEGLQFAVETAPLDERVNPTTDACSGTATIESNRTAFTMSERAEDRACARASINVTIPAGASAGEVTFLSGRHVEYPETDLVEAVQVVQRFTVRSDGNGTLPTADYIAAGVGEHATARFTYPFSLDALATNLTLEWFMHDKGTGESDRAAPSALGAAVAVPVRDIAVTWRGLTGPDFGPARIVAEEALDETRHLVTYQQTLQMQELGASASSWHLLVGYAADKELVGVQGPGVNLTAHEVPTATLQGETLGTVALGAAPLAGDYVFSFQSLEQVPPPPPAVRLSVAPLYEVTVGVIGFVALGAAYASVNYWRVATGGFRAAATRFLGAVALIIGYFVFQVIYTAGSIGVDEMNYQNRGAQADTFYVQLGLVGFLLAGLWYVAARIETRRMAADIRERKEREDELKRSNEELEQFAYVASHDLQEPLRKVASYTQLLQRKYEGQLDADADEFIGYAVSGAKRMQKLITDILDYSRVGQRPVEVEQVDLGELMEGVREDLHLRIAESKAQLIWKDLPMIRTDGALLQQVLYNVVGNGLKFQKPRAKPRVEVSAEVEGDRTTIWVRDNGIGIAKEHHERVFAVFKRLHRADDYAGTGIGLALCRKIIERLGGTITLDSAPGKGSTFIIELPGASA